MRFKKKWKGFAHIGNGLMIKLHSIKISGTINAIGGGGRDLEEEK